MNGAIGASKIPNDKERETELPPNFSINTSIVSVKTLQKDRWVPNNDE